MGILGKTRSTSVSTCACVALLSLAEGALANGSDAGLSALLARQGTRVALIDPPPLPSPVPTPRTAADPFEAAQLGIDWLLPSVCSWMQDPDNQENDCTDDVVKSCLGCHVQGESAFAASRAASRCYTLPATPCSAPGDESPMEFVTRFMAGAQRKDCIIGPRTCNGPRQDGTTRDGLFPELGSIGLFTECGAKPRRTNFPMANSTHGGLNLAGYSTWVSPRYSGNLTALADWFVIKQQPDGRFVPDHVLLQIGRAHV